MRKFETEQKEEGGGLVQLKSSLDKSYPDAAQWSKAKKKFGCPRFNPSQAKLFKGAESIQKYNFYLFTIGYVLKLVILTSDWT